ncbi:MAG: DNA internalization-related competence protein ComEC/Rec2, partial [Candidatus Rokuibacteriota bacterium]
LWLFAIGAAALALAAPSHRSVALATAGVLVGVAAVGVLRAAAPSLPPDHVAHLPLPRDAKIIGRLVGEPRRWSADRARLLVDVERVDEAPRMGRVQIAAYGALPPLATGQRIEIDSRLARPSEFRNPGGFDYTRWLADQDVFVVATARAEHVAPLEEPSPPWHVRVRRHAVTTMEATLPPVSAALLAGLLFGERAGLPADVDDGFRRAGVYHVLAVSGFNVAILAGAVWATLALVGVGRRMSAIAAIAAVLAFAAVVGPEPSVLRATIMAVLLLAALLLERESAVINSLALAALVILGARPGDLRDPGFQLSFAATAGIVLAPLPRTRVLAAIGVSIAAQLAVLPITLVHFNQLSTLGVLANLGVVPLAGVATVLGLAAVALSFVYGAAAAVLLDAIWPALLLLRALVALVAAVPGALVYFPSPSPVATALYATALGLALLAWHARAVAARRARWLATGAGACLFTALTLAVWPVVRPPDGHLRVTMLDVGQGDAIAIEAPDGRVALIDTGAGGPYRLDAGARVVAPFLWSRGVLRLAALAVTHADLDHAGGSAAVRRRFSVRDDWTAETFRDGPVFFGGATVSLVSPHQGRSGLEARGRGGVRGELSLSTEQADPAPSPRDAFPSRHASVRNNEALVLRVETGAVTIVLASDIEADAERALVSAHAPLTATVLKVAHHGSRTSSTPAFLASVRPTVAVISVGARNSYGHPDAGVLARLTAAGAIVYRTDRDGALVLETDGRVLTVTRWATRTTERYCVDPEAIC